jgi:hypothetical protein
MSGQTPNFRTSAHDVPTRVGALSRRLALMEIGFNGGNVDFRVVLTEHISPPQVLVDELYRRPAEPHAFGKRMTKAVNWSEGLPPIS